MDALFASLQRPAGGADSSESDDDGPPPPAAVLSASMSSSLTAATARGEMDALFASLRGSTAAGVTTASSSSDEDAPAEKAPPLAGHTSSPPAKQEPRPMLPGAMYMPRPAAPPPTPPPPRPAPSRASATSMLALLGVSAPLPPAAGPSHPHGPASQPHPERHVVFAPRLVTATRAGGGAEIVAELAAVEAERAKLAAMSMTARLEYRGAQRKAAAAEAAGTAAASSSAAASAAAASLPAGATPSRGRQGTMFAPPAQAAVAAGQGKLARPALAERTRAALQIW